MKTLVLGDTHGRDTWKEILKQESWDHVVFLGDYFDTHEGIGAEAQLANFHDIVLLKQALPDQVTLLLGNHDFHYLPSAESDRYSGWQAEDASEIQELLVKHLDLLQAVVQVEDYVCSHAGLTLLWCIDHRISTNSVEEMIGDVNQEWRTTPKSFRFYRLDYGGYGNHPKQGPLWVRPESLASFPACAKQIVGHTTQRSIKQGNLMFADAIGSGQFVIVEDGVLRVSTLAQSMLGSQN